ncbi:MAG: N-6 DNA methylase [Pseudomonadota bacterium]
MTQGIESPCRNLLEAHAQPPEGIRFYSSLGEILADSTLSAYSHLLTRAWHDFELTGVVCVDGIPTLYLRFFSQRLKPEQAAEYHRLFWNQGVATILVLVDPVTVRLYSGLAVPAKPGHGAEDEKSLIETLSLTDYALRVREFYLQLATGQYYRDRPDKFDPKQSVDTYLLNDLAAIRDAITTGSEKLNYPEAHAFLARVLFTCYLIDRGIIDLAHYEYCACNAGAKLVDLLEQLGTVAAKDILYRLFDDLKDKFNGSMFDHSTATERECIRESHIELLIKFLRGSDVRKGQLTLGFWVYDFKWIPVETISAIYEDFLAKEDEKAKQQTGAFYTPRFLAETVLDIAVQGHVDWESKRFLDPACGSGIFLVAVFNRLAARWLARHPEGAYEEKAAALLAIMRDQLCGIDTSPTACRIACFSLYLAFLDRFDPPDIAEYVERTGRKLPRILLSAETGIPDPDFPVILQEDFLNPSRPLPRQFGYVVGNPPWIGRGKEQIAQHFALQIPEYLDHQGRACILLPSKVLLNQTSNQFQTQWLKSITLEKIVQLADYRFILFKNAKCPSIIARFTAATPDVETHGVDYETPKVRRIDLRGGVIPVAPADRKWIPLRELLQAAGKNKVPIIWKKHIWGTPRDNKFLSHLIEMPELGEIAGAPKEKKRWIKGQGFQPDSRGTSPDPKNPWWDSSDLYVSAGGNIPSLLLIPGDCQPVGDRFASLHRPRDRRIYKPPLVLISQGIGKGALPKVVYCDFPVLFQDSLQSIAGPPEDEDLLLFLAMYLRSKLARYFLFHTSANWGTERDKVHLNELLRLPFPLPGSEDAPPHAEEIVRTIADKARSLKKRIEKEFADTASADKLKLSGTSQRMVSARRKKDVDALQTEVEPLILQYFDLIDQEIMLIEDTVEVFIESATPHSVDSSVPALEPIHNNTLPTYQAGISVYADALTDTLNSWAEQASGTVRVSATGGIDDRAGLASVTLEQTRQVLSFKRKDVPVSLGDALAQLQNTSTQRAGRLDYLRGIIWFDEKRIRIVKPLAVEFWTKTAALNDAAEIYAQVAMAREATRRS